jgi:phage baseplate assembly protein W
MNLTGSTLSFPFRVAAGGTLAVVRTAEDIAREALIDVIETQPGERKMMPEYGMRDYAFAPLNAGFARRFEINLRRQVEDYIPTVELLAVEVSVGDHRVEASVRYRLRGGMPRDFVYPLWQLRQTSS